MSFTNTSIMLYSVAEKENQTKFILERKTWNGMEKTIIRHSSWQHN